MTEVRKVRPPQNPGVTKKMETACGGLYLIDNTDSEYPEIFLTLGKSGGCSSSFCQFIARLISFALRAGITKERIIQAGLDIRCHTPKISGGKEVLSCADAICKMLKEGGQ